MWIRLYYDLSIKLYIVAPNSFPMGGIKHI